jgi:hypothetical protein
VSISAAGIDGDPPLALTISGTLAEGTELLRDPVGAEECIYLSFEEDRGAGLFVHSNVFRGGLGRLEPRSAIREPRSSVWRDGRPILRLVEQSPQRVLGYLGIRVGCEMRQSGGGKLDVLKTRVRGEAGEPPARCPGEPGVALPGKKLAEF